MGAYLSHPITEKVSSDEKNDRLKCGASSMQGWRVSQEDAHNCILDFSGNASLFAVYDGHGGKEVAEYSAQKLPDVIKNLESFQKGEFELALKEAFLAFDKSLTEPEVVETLKAIAAKNEGSDVTAKDEDDLDENLGDLKEEAAMPLDQVMARYKKESGEAKDVSISSNLQGGRSDEGCSSSISSSSKDQDDVPVVSSSSSSQPSCSSKRETVRRSLQEKYSNGELHKGGGEEVGGSDEVVHNGEKEGKQEEVTSSLSNGPSEVEEKVSTKKSLSKETPGGLFMKLMSAEGIEDDSSDSDENFAEQGSSSSDDDAGPVAEGDEDGESEDADEDEDEEEEEEDDDDADDDFFTMKMTDDLVAAIKEGRPLTMSGQSDSDEEEDGVSRRFLLDALTKKRPACDSGCTAVVALVLQDRVFVANAGDSRCVACRAGQAVDLSIDHKPEDPQELARIVKAGGKVTSDGRVNGGLNLSRALGDHVYKQTADLPAEEQMISPAPDIKEIALSDDVEFLILACDGIWNFMSSQDAVDYVRTRLRKNPDHLSSICEELFDHCLAPHTCGDGTGCDNMTAIIVQFRPIPEDSTESEAAVKQSADFEASSLQDEEKSEVARRGENLEGECGKRRADGESENLSKRTKTDADFPEAAP